MTLSSRATRPPDRDVSVRQSKTCLVHWNRHPRLQWKAAQLRISIRNALAGIASTVPHTRFFDPTSMIDAVGAETFMQDLGHYKPANEPRVAEEVINEIDAFAREDSMIRALQNRRARR